MSGIDGVGPLRGGPGTIQDTGTAGAAGVAGAGERRRFDASLAQARAHPPRRDESRATEAPAGSRKPPGAGERAPGTAPEPDAAPMLPAAGLQRQEPEFAQAADAPDERGLGTVIDRPIESAQAADPRRERAMPSGAAQDRPAGAQAAGRGAGHGLTDGLERGGDPGIAAGPARTPEPATPLSAPEAPGRTADTAALVEWLLARLPLADAGDRRVTLTFPGLAVPVEQIVLVREAGALHLAVTPRAGERARVRAALDALGERLLAKGLRVGALTLA